MAVFNRNYSLLLTILLIAFCVLHNISEARVLHNISEAKAPAATLLSKNSIDPPFGNSYELSPTKNVIYLY